MSQRTRSYIKGGFAKREGIHRDLFYCTTNKHMCCDGISYFCFIRASSGHCSKHLRCTDFHQSVRVRDACRAILCSAACCARTQSGSNRAATAFRASDDLLEIFWKHAATEAEQGPGGCVTANIIISLLRRGTYSQMRQAENRIYTTLRHTEPLIRRCNPPCTTRYMECPPQNMVTFLTY